MPLSIMLDSSFVISLLTKGERNHDKAESYFRFFLAEKIDMQISTIAVSELEIPAGAPVLPEKLFIFVPYNVEHARASSDLAMLFRNELSAQAATAVAAPDRVRVKDDTKIIAQALVLGTDFLITSDNQMHSRCEWLRTKQGKSLRAIDLNLDLSLHHFTPDGQSIFL